MKKNILLVATGSVAVVKTRALYNLLKNQYNVKTIISPMVIQNFEVDFPYEQENKDLTSFPLHIKHAKWADLIVVAPATANTLSKFVTGIADNQVLSTLLAARGKILFAPAMNSYMYRAISKRYVFEKLSQLSGMTIGPNYGKLREGEVGIGRMAEPKEIFQAVNNYFTSSKKNILILNGASKVYIDPIRFISNDASGKLGQKLENELKLKGHNVFMIDVAKQDSNTLVEMIKSVDFDLLVSPAAINDFDIKKLDKKIKKSDKLILEMQKSIDIVSQVAQMGKKIIIFKHDDNKQSAIAKMKKINSQMVIWNKIGSMGKEVISGAIIFNDLSEIPFQDINKSTLAALIAKEI